MISKLSRRQVLTGIGLAGIAGLAPSVAAQSNDPAHPAAAFPLPGTAGFGRGQVARIGVLHHSHGANELPPEPCNIVADILNAEGKVIASQAFSDLGPNEARFMDFVHPGRRGSPLSTHMEIMGLVRFTPGHEIGSSMQIVDSASGATVLIPPICNFPDPGVGGQDTGDHAGGEAWLGGPAGLVRRQVIRMSIVRHLHKAPGSAKPCQIVAQVLDTGGKLLASRTFTDPAPHQAMFLDFAHPGGQGRRHDTRMEVSLHVRHTPGHEVGSTAQLIDLVSGLILIPPICNIPDPTL